MFYVREFIISVSIYRNTLKAVAGNKHNMKMKWWPHSIILIGSIYKIVNNKNNPPHFLSFRTGG